MGVINDLMKQNIKPDLQTDYLNYVFKVAKCKTWQNVCVSCIYYSSWNALFWIVWLHVFALWQGLI